MKSSVDLRISRTCNYNNDDIGTQIYHDLYRDKSLDSNFPTFKTIFCLHQFYSNQSIWIMFTFSRACETWCGQDSCAAEIMLIALVIGPSIAME